MIVVDLIQVGREIRSFEISNNPTVGGLLEQAGEQFVPSTITINSNGGVTSETRLNNGDKVFLGSKVKGNTPFTVEFIRLGQGETIRVSAEGEVTIRGCVDMMGDENRARFIDSNGNDVFQYQVSGVTRGGDDIISPTADGGMVRVICSTKVKGN